MKRETFFRSAMFAAFVGFVFYLGASIARAQSTAFTYQGRLTDAARAGNGIFDLGFALFDAPTGGRRQSA